MIDNKRILFSEVWDGIERVKEQNPNKQTNKQTSRCSIVLPLKVSRSLRWLANNNNNNNYYYYYYVIEILIIGGTRMTFTSSLSKVS